MHKPQGTQGCTEDPRDLIGTSLGDFPAQWKKGAGMGSAPFSVLLSLLYQFVPGYTANFSGFILLGGSST